MRNARAECMWLVLAWVSMFVRVLGTRWMQVSPGTDSACDCRFHRYRTRLLALSPLPRHLGINGERWEPGSGLSGLHVISLHVRRICAACIGTVSTQKGAIRRHRNITHRHTCFLSYANRQGTDVLTGKTEAEVGKRKLRSANFGTPKGMLGRNAMPASSLCES